MTRKSRASKRKQEAAVQSRCVWSQGDGCCSCSWWLLGQWTAPIPRVLLAACGPHMLPAYAWLLRCPHSRHPCPLLQLLLLLLLVGTAATRPLPSLHPPLGAAAMPAGGCMTPPPGAPRKLPPPGAV
jgi:hypothetical protein